MTEHVEVIDLTLITTTPGVVLQHTIRPHEGDQIVEEAGAFRLLYGSREVVVEGETRMVPGRRVMIQSSHIVEMTTTMRLEPKVRPSVQALANRAKADLEALKQKHGVATVIPFPTKP